MANRPVHLDISALSPAEYEAYREFIEEFERELERKGGQLRFAEAASLLRRWYDFDAEREDEVRTKSASRCSDCADQKSWQIRCFFSQKTQLGGMRLGSALAVLRLLAHARRSSAALKPDHVFTQAAPVPRVKAGSPSVSRSVSLSKPRSNPFRSHPQPDTDNVDTSPFRDGAVEDTSAGSTATKPSLPAASSPLVRNGQSNAWPRTAPTSINPTSPLADSNPFRNRSLSSHAMLEQTASHSMPPPSPATAQAFSPPLPPRPSMQWRASGAPPARSVRSEDDSTVGQMPPPPPPKHHSHRREGSDEVARPVAKLTRSDSSPPMSRPTSIRKASGWSGTSGPKATKKIQSTTTVASSSSSLGTWVVPTNVTGSANGSPAIAAKPRLASSTHLGMDVRLRNSPSPQLGSDNEEGRLLKPYRARSESSTSSRGVHRRALATTSGALGMGIQYETIASSSSPVIGSASKMPPIPPPASKKPSSDSRSQPDVGVKSFDADEARDSVGNWPPSTGPQHRVPSLGRSKTVGHKAPPPAPPPRRKRPESMQLYNPNSTTLEDLARQPTGDGPNEEKITAMTGRPGPPVPSSSHSRTSSLASGASPLNRRNLKTLEGNLAAGAAHLRQDSRNIVKDIQEGWSRRHGKPDEKEALVDKAGTGKRKPGARPSAAATASWHAGHRDDDRSDDDDGYARLD